MQLAIHQHTGVTIAINVLSLSADLYLTMCVRQWSASVCGCCCWAACGEAVVASCGERGGGRWRRETAGVLLASPAAAGSPAGSSPGLHSSRSVLAWGALPGCPGGSPPCLPAGPCLPPALPPPAPAPAKWMSSKGSEDISETKQCTHQTDASALSESKDFLKI